MKSIYFLILNYIHFVPYAYGLLRAHAEQNPAVLENYAWNEPFCEMEPVDSIVEKIIDPDVLLCSCYGWNFNNQMYIAERVKERYPGCTVICGGPHIPDDSEDYFRDHPQVDILVHGEGEMPLEGVLVQLLQESPDLGNVPGITYQEDGEAARTEETTGLPKNLTIPSPYLLGFFDDYIRTHPDALGLWETSRGCPFSCSFCSWAVDAMNKIKLHDMDRVREEIAFIAEHKIHEVYVTDPNFGLLKRDLEIARLLVENKKRTGYPLGLRFNFAKNSNETVFEISKLLYENDMLWGTTLTMQSVDHQVQGAINRPSVSIDRYRELKGRYKRLGIPTYTELILGLPQETRESFINGICHLFEIGIHEDIRVFELALLPNAPLSRKSSRKKYGIKSRKKPIHVTNRDHRREYVELVFETQSLPYEDWNYCLLFAESIQALHNGGFTRFLSIYLNDRNVLSYADFYDGFLQFALKGEGESLEAFKRMKKLINDFYEDPSMPHVHRLMTQPDIVAFLKSYSQKRKAYKLFTYIWLWISEYMDDFYRNLETFLKGRAVGLDREMRDLLQYQKEIMLTLDYDPRTGKKVKYRFNWFETFFEGKALKAEPCHLHYQDTHMGNTHRYPLVKNDRQKFINAAIGYAYPYSKFRHFFHQPDRVKKLPLD